MRHLIGYEFSEKKATKASTRKRVFLSLKNIRKLTFIKYKNCDNSSPYYKRLKILKLKDLFKLEVGKFIHSNLKKMLPKNLSNYFILTSQISEKNTRLNEKSKKLCIFPFVKLYDYKDV